jgi:peptidoglycan/LPS O-acetylase OafA/YrhL
MHVALQRESSGHLAHFLRHLLEMVLVMMVGMAAGGAIFVMATGIPADQAIENHAIAWVSVMAFSMTAPMVVWMRHRGHAWSMSLEMAATMVAPAIPLCILRAADVISGGVGGTYCGLSLLAMVSVVVYRRDYYGHSTTAVDT